MTSTHSATKITIKLGEQCLATIGPMLSSGQIAAGLRAKALLQSITDNGVLHVERITADAVDVLIDSVARITGVTREYVDVMPMHDLVDVVGQLLEELPDVLPEYFNGHLTPAVQALGKRLAGYAEPVADTAQPSKD